MIEQIVSGAPRLPFQEFDHLYRAVTGHDSACRWQHRLFTDIEAGRFPTDVELATGLGKTSVIALWVLALGCTLSRKLRIVPRRLAYIVDRRVVVDQASEFAEQIRERLERAALDQTHPLYAIAKTLRNAGCTPSVIEVSTLRGQRMLDTCWRDDPTRPAIIVGTVDMIGSRLLFSGYGRQGPWSRALEAGLIGQDCMLILDEAHLCSPFAMTLTAIERRIGTLTPFAVVRMGATMRPVHDLLRRTPGLPEEKTIRCPFRLLEADTTINGFSWPQENSERKISDRLTAKKRIEVEHLDSKRGAGIQLAAWAVAKSQMDKGAVIGVVLNTVAQVRRCAAEIRERVVADEHLLILTGSMRGWDRDIAVDSAKYARLKSQRDRSTLFDSPLFLVATPCVEVGADIDCDHLGVEACAADSLIQRLGRVNRLGASTHNATVRLVGDANGIDPAGQVFQRVQALVAKEPEVHGSPASFPALLKTDADDSRSMFEVRVPPPALTCSVLDDFAMTSKYPKVGARPDVGRWLHGSVQDSSLYVELAWRAELDLAVELEDAERLVAAFPIGARETARCPLYEAVELLTAIRERAVEDDALGQRVLLVTRYGTTARFRLRDVPADEDGELRALLHDATAILPTTAGGYDGQFINSSSKQPVSDVAEQAQPTSRAQRRRLWIDSGAVRSSSSAAGSEPQHIPRDTDAADLLSEVQDIAADLLGTGWRLVEGAGSGALGVVVARENRRTLEEAEDDDASLGFQGEVLLGQHLGDARTKAEELCTHLALPDELRASLIEAAGRHDIGKDRPWWQRAVGRVEKPAVAKSGCSRFDHKINRGYRHELGSLSDIEIAKLPDTVDRDLCLHLVAAHHGHGRPGFRVEAAGPVLSDSLKLALTETPIRFADLQARYGWWALAWLEALVKAADVLASPTEGASRP